MYNQCRYIFVELQPNPIIISVKVLKSMKCPVRALQGLAFIKWHTETEEVSGYPLCATGLCRETIESSFAAVRHRVRRTSSGPVATPDIGQAKPRQGRWLGGCAEQGSNEVALCAHVVRWCTYNLSLVDHRHRLKAGNRLRGSCEALEPQPRTNQSFDAPVILLDYVI